MKSPDDLSFDPVRAFAAAFAAAAAFALTSRYPGYVHHDTAEIAMWSTLGWPLGLPKHPPLLPWLFRAVSLAVPLDFVTIGLMTAANIVVGAWAVWRIAVLTIATPRAGLALMLYGLAPAGTFFALKLNHNAILVSLWPLTILAFLSCLRAKTLGHNIAAGVAFGVLAAAAMLAKYYSGVLLVCCFAASLVSPHCGHFYRRPGGYLAVAVFATLLAPHALWVIANPAMTLEYALHESERDAHPLLHFLLVAPAYAVPPVAAAMLLSWRSKGRLRDTARSLWRAQPELAVLAAGPYLLTAVFIAVFKLRGATSWSLPDFCVVPVLLAAALRQPEPAAYRHLVRVALAGLAVVALAGPAVLATAFSLADANAVEPRAETALAAEKVWRAATGRAVSLVGGDPQSANTAAFMIPSRPLAFTNFDAAFAPWVTPDRLTREGLLVICRPSYGGCQEQAARAATSYAGFVCNLALQRHLFGLVGPPQPVEITAILPVGVPASVEAAKAACAAGGARFARLTGR